MHTNDLSARLCAQRVILAHACCLLWLTASACVAKEDDQDDDANAGADGSAGGAGASAEGVAGNSGAGTAGMAGTGSDVAGASGADAAPAGLLVTLDDGQVQGEMAGAARRFLGIPFAKPPVGELRFKAPVQNDPWSDVLHNTEFVQSCPQNADQGAPASTNEDCLYLNVWSPEPAPTNAPVMVWIHGGGNFSGGAGIPVPQTADLWYDGQHFAANQGVVLVTIQYRLGPLGFFAHPGLAAEGEPAGNQGLLDQRMALSWVQRNIAKFGGNPDNVTIFGESAGSADVCYHVASPGSWGLFHRAIGQSGGCTIRAIGPERAPSEVGEQMEAYGAAVGCPVGDDQLTCLRQAAVEDLLANAMQPMPGAGEASGAGEWSFAVVVDGPEGFLPDSPQALFDRGEIADVPYLLGANNDEGTTFTWRATPLMTEAEYLADLEQRYGDAAAEIAALYPPDALGGFNPARARVVGDAGVVCSTHDTARRAAAAGRTVFLYNFNVAWSLLPAVFLAGHAAEISHVFGKPFGVPDADSQAVADTMNRYWARFAETGDPNEPDAPMWPSFHPEMDQRLELAPGFAVLTDFRTAECAFWRQYHGAE